MRDEDIFRRLKKETPIVKRKDLQPLPQQDSAPKRSSFGMFTGKTNEKRDERVNNYQTRTGSYQRPDANSAKKTEQEGLSLYNDAARSDTERVQRPQPRTIQARSETRIRTSPEPLKRPEVRTVTSSQQLKMREETASTKQPETRAAKPQVTIREESARQPQDRQADVQPQLKLREESSQPQTHTVSAQPQITLREDPRKDMHTASPQPREAAETLQVRKSSIRNPYTRAEAAELEIFNEASPKKQQRVRSDSPAMAPMRVHRTEFDEFYEPVQAADSAPAFRHELKYYINYAEYILLRNTLKALAQLDKYAGENGEYYIRSLYFDDEYESALFEKLGGSDSRKKYRIRIYNFSDDVIKFEKKIKQGQFITKKTISLSRDEYDSIMAGEYAFLLRRKEPLASELFLELTNSRLRPRVIVDYVREAYVYPFENVRITFDKDLRSGMWLSPDIFDPNLPTMPMYEEGMLVLEVKFEKSLPAHIRGVLNNIDAAERCAISKYVICRKFE
jgi:hypothetical protein